MTRKKRKREMAKFPRVMKKKLMVTFLLITIAMVCLIARLMYIEVQSGEKYEKIVLAQQEYNSRQIPYRRGDILDRKGNVLATSVDVYNVILDCKVLNSQKKCIKPTVRALLSCFDGLDEENLYALIKEKPKSQYNKLLTKLPYSEIQDFIELSNDTDKNPNIAGVWMEKEYMRSYPYNSLASGVIGYTTQGDEGIGGLEDSYNDTLNGINGREYGYLNADNNFQKTVREEINGRNLVTTLDVNIQSVVEEKMEEFNKAFQNDAEEGDGCKNMGVIVMDPNNGEILAMADYPNYDLNNPRNLESYYTKEQISAMSDEEQIDALNRIWENFCITHTYEPGSTVKPLTVATGLETGTLTGNETYVCDGVERVGGHDIHCVVRTGHGTVTIEQAIMESCNDALMQMSFAIQKENMVNYQKIFGFGQKTNIDLPGEARTDTLMYTLDTMDDASLATNAFGQNFNVNMVQMASAFASLINGGEYYWPHMVKKITDENGNLIEEIKGTLLKQTVSEETSEQVKQYLLKTVSEGTGNMAKVPGYSMGGKTGTAQKYETVEVDGSMKTQRAEGKYLVSFIGYAPQENPQLLIYVVIDEPNVEDQAHSNYAQNVTREILKEVLPYMGIYQDEEYDPATVVDHDIMGNPVTEATPSTPAATP